jgi:transcriptional regulator with GAF, ATPase, and Fis domain
MAPLPPRYEPTHRLGAGGGGEVWRVRDRVNGQAMAFKVLAPGAGEAEVEALVREAIALSGLEGLGVPRVVAFGTLRDGRRYMVRELVEGRSLEEILRDGEGGDWLEAIATACDQLTVIHRAGLLHGDVKPANIIVAPDGRGTLVDLGLSQPWREGGVVAQGITPKYAAPELLQGEPLTVRAEIYALGATLAEALATRGHDLSDEARRALEAVAARATAAIPTSRWPSTDELASGLRLATGLPHDPRTAETPWPVLGLDACARAVIETATRLGPGDALAIEGPAGAGKTTLARRLAWTLGARGEAVAIVETPGSGMAVADVVELELAHYDDRPAHAGLLQRAVFSPVLVVDDVDLLDGAGRAALQRASIAGARLIVVGPHGPVGNWIAGAVTPFSLPPLDVDVASELLHRAVPSLPDALRAHLLERTGRWPGPLRAAVRRLAGRAVVARQDIDAALDGSEASSVSPVPADRAEHLGQVERALDRGRLDEAAALLSSLGPARGETERVRMDMLGARLEIGRGDVTRALVLLENVEHAAQTQGKRRAWLGLRARACLRAARHADAAASAEAVVADEATDALAADALSVRGVALAYTGEPTAAAQTLAAAVRVANDLGEPRAQAVAFGSSAIAHQRAGRTAEARADYEASLAAAERAQDAATVATIRLNLASIAQAEGDIAQALGHLEAAVDMGRRAGIGAAVTQALLNLAALDLYLGRWARARSSIGRLASKRGELSDSARAQLLGLEAVHASRTGDATRAAGLYERAAISWESQDREQDAAESRLEALLARARSPGEPSTLMAELEAIRALGAGFGEHAALAEFVRATIAHASGLEDEARKALDASIAAARKTARTEWEWQALDLRARLAAAQGSMAIARRDTEAALAMLEETAARLPRDLREVFWDDPRRRALRQAHTATVGAPGGLPYGAANSPVTAMSSRTRGGEDRLSRILEITRELATEHEIGRLLQKVTDHAVALVGAERGFVLLVGEKGELEAHTARTRAGDDDPHARFSRSVAASVVQSHEPVVTLSAQDDARLAEAVSVHQLMIKSIACVPIRGAPPVGQTIGALYLETRVNPGVRFDQEIPTLRAFADQAAIAIENARLLEENRARAEALARANVDLSTARDDLAMALGKRTEQLAEARRDLKQVRAELRSHFGYAGLVGTSAAMRRVYALVDRVKDTDVPLLISGESGTGKEMVARAVHQAGPRAKKTFVGVNCGAIPANLLESELFGSTRGAYTGADRDRPGLFREANGGTLLLDEIGELPQKMQMGLLRVLQERKVRPVGAAQEQDVDVRVIAATHRDLARMVEEKTFREDLYYRLHVIDIHVPALRERAEDIPLLIDHFLSLFSTRYRRDRKSLSRAALRKVCVFPWPGNVRQLEHVLLSAWLMTDAAEIRADDLELPSFGPGSGRESRPSTSDGVKRRSENKTEHKAAERDRILNALTASNWNRVRAAKLIGLPRRTFYRRLKEFGFV